MPEEHFINDERLNYHLDERWIEKSKLIIGDKDNRLEICIICGKPAELLHHPINQDAYNNVEEYIQEIFLTPLCTKCHYLLHRNNKTFRVFMENKLGKKLRKSKTTEHLQEIVRKRKQT